MAIRINGPVTSRANVSPANAVYTTPIEYTDTGSNRNSGTDYAAAVQMARAASSQKPATPAVVDDSTPATNNNNNNNSTKASSSSSKSYSGGGGGGSSASVNPNASILSLLAQNYNNAIRAVQDRYALEEQKMANENEDALRQAYINYMMSRKNMDNDMSRMGYTGGLTESNYARMYNNYGNIRADLIKQRQQQLAEQNLRKNQELYDLLAQYNNQQMRYAL